MDKLLFSHCIIYESSNFILSQDWEVPIECFFILSSKRKIRSITEFSEKEMIEFALLLQQTRKGMHDVFGIEEVYLFQNEDTEHNFHMWIFPRHKWMNALGCKIQSVRPIMDYAKKNFQTSSAIHRVEDAAIKFREFFNNTTQQ